MTKKKLLIISLVSITIFLAIASLFYLFPMSFVSSGYAEGSLSYTNNKLIISFNSQPGNPRIDAGNCYHLGLIDNCRGVTSGGTLMLQEVDEITCNQLGASWERQSSARGCDSKACYIGNMDLSQYVILSKNISNTNLYFDNEDFKATKTLNICNNGSNNIASSSATVILIKDYDVTAFILSDNACSPIVIKKSQANKYFSTLEECSSSINKIEIYRFENNQCVKYTIFPTDMKTTDYTDLTACTVNIKDNTTLYIIVITIFILLTVAGGICIMAGKAKKKKKR